MLGVEGVRRAEVVEGSQYGYFVVHGQFCAKNG